MLLLLLLLLLGLLLSLLLSLLLGLLLSLMLLLLLLFKVLLLRRRIQRFGRNDLNLAQVLSGLGDDVLRLDQVLRLRHHRNRVRRALAVLVVRPLVVVQQRQVVEHQPAYVALEADVGDGILEGLQRENAVHILTPRETFSKNLP